MIEQVNNLDDLENSTNIPFEELYDESPEKGTTFYFYKAKSYIKEQSARIVIERNAVSILCIETDLSKEPYDLESYFNNENEIINGFITVGNLTSNNIKLQKVKFNDDSSLQFKELEQPIIEINIPLDFLKNNIYLVSLIDLSINDINYDNLFIIDGSINEMPNIINKHDIEQVPENALNLISLTTYNASRINSISVNKITPISLNNILTDEQDINKLIFTMNTDLILFSNIQGYTKISVNNIETIKSCKIDVYNKENDNIITTKLPIKLSCTNFNDSIQLNNEWKDLLLPWNIAKQFLQQQDLEDLLTIKNIPTIKTIYNNIKINSTDVIGKIVINDEFGFIEKTKITTNEIEGNLITVNSINGVVTYLTNEIAIDYDDKFNVNDLFNLNKEDGNTEIITNSGNVIIKNKNIDYGQYLYYNLKIKYDETVQDTFIDYPLTNNLFRESNISGQLLRNPSNLKLISTPTLITNKNIEKNYTGNQINIDVTINAEHKYEIFTTSSPATDDNKILVKFFKKLLKYTVNQRFNFAGATYDADGNPSNEIAKLKAEFQIQGTNPLQNISNLISNFIMLNPWVNQVPEWSYFLYCIIALSSNIYSTYSLNTGDKSPEEIALPYYLQLVTPAIKVGTDPNKIYDYVSLQVQLVSKYYDFSNYNDLPFNNKMFSKLTTLDSKFTVENQYIKLVYPFLNSSLQETIPVKNPQKYNIENEDFQKYFLYFITSINNTDINHGTNKKVFDDYMNTIFLSDKNYQNIKDKWETFTCKTAEIFYSSDNSLIGDLPFNAKFDNTTNSDILISSNNSLIITEITSNEPILSSNNSIIIVKG